MIVAGHSVKNPAEVLYEESVLVTVVDLAYAGRKPTMASVPLLDSDLDSDSTDTELDRRWPDRVQLDLVPWTESAKYGVEDLAGR